MPQQFIEILVPRETKVKEKFGVRDRAYVPWWVSSQCDGCKFSTDENEGQLTAILTHSGRRIYMHARCAEERISFE